MGNLFPLSAPDGLESGRKKTHLHGSGGSVWTVGCSAAFQTLTSGPRQPLFVSPLLRLPDPHAPLLPSRMSCRSAQDWVSMELHGSEMLLCCIRSGAETPHSSESSNTCVFYITSTKPQWCFDTLPCNSAPHSHQTHTHTHALNTHTHTHNATLFYAQCTLFYAEQ